MFCTFYKWMISRRLDTGKEIPNFLRYHLNNCPNCLDFAKDSHTLTARLMKKPSLLPHSKNSNLEKRIISALNSAPIQSSAKNKILWNFKFNPLPIMIVSGILIAVVILGLVFHTNTTPNSPNVMDPFRDLTAQHLLKNPLQVIENVESPMEKEIKLLGQSVKSATHYLISNFDFKFGQE